MKKMERMLAKTKFPDKGNLMLSRKEIGFLAVAGMGFFIGRVVVMDFVNPLSMAYICNFFGAGAQIYLLAVLTAAGLATKLSGLYLYRYVFCVGILAAVNFIFFKKSHRPGIFVKAAVGSGCVLGSGILFALVDGLSLYFTFMVVLESLLTFFATVVLKRGTAVIAGTRRKKVLQGEEIISVAILFGAVIAGASDIYVGYVSLRFFMSGLVVLMVCHKGGISMGAATGVLLGAMFKLSGYTDTGFVFPMILALAGICGGFAKRWGKAGTASGFFLGSLIFAAYFDINLLGLELFVSNASAVAAFMAVPDNFYFSVSPALNPVIDNAEEYIRRVREIVTYRLDSVSASFLKLSETLSGLSEKNVPVEQKDISKLVDELSAKACSKCTMSKFCWQDNFYDTYQTVYGVLGACEKKGYARISDVPPGFRNSCVDPKKFVEIINRLYEINKVNFTWRAKVAESRELVAQQLTGIGRIIKNMSEELDISIDFKEDLEHSILAELAKEKIDVENVVVYQNKTGRYEVGIEHKPCHGKKQCVKSIAPAVSKVIGRRMKTPERDCAYKKGYCNLRLVEEQKYKVACGVSRATKTGSTASGDSYSFMELKNGRYMLALSDGMGSGRRAASESAATVELLEDFIESGFEKDIAVKMINSVLVLKSVEDTFSTLDICTLDLYTGEAEFTKIGAASTFLLRDGAVSSIKSTSLPIGILSTVDVDVCVRKLSPDDMVIMVTDGATEMDGTLSDKGAWIVDALAGVRSGNPQEIADYLLTEAEKKSEDGIIKDDITVLAARMYSNIYSVRG